jgi:hypothetical protein
MDFDSAPWLFCDERFYVEMRDVALDARAAMDPEGYGNTDERVDQIQNGRTAGGFEGDVDVSVIFDPRTQRDMVDYLNGTLVSDEALRILGAMREVCSGIIEANERSRRLSP